MGLSNTSKNRELSAQGLTSSAGLELIKVEKLTHCLNTIAKIDKPFDTFETCMYELKNILGASNCYIYVLEDSMFHRITLKMPPTKNRFLTKVAFEGVTYNVITNNFDGQMKPAFTTIEQAQYGFRTNDKMVFPITNHMQHTLLLFECERTLDIESTIKSRNDDLGKEHSLDSGSNEVMSNMDKSRSIISQFTNPS